MNTHRVEELELAIGRLPVEEFRRLANWVNGRDQTLWDLQLDRDCQDGKLDFLFKEAEDEGSHGFLREWRPANKNITLGESI